MEKQQGGTSVSMASGMICSAGLMEPYFNQGYHLYVDNFYSSLTLMKHLFEKGVPATGITLETRHSFPANLKNSKVWANGKERGTPCLVLQWLDNKVVSMITSVVNANDHVQVTRREKTAGVYNLKVVQPPKTFKTYNKYMNAVDRSYQILATFNILRNCLKWWKTMFYYLNDIVTVNSYILFLDHQAQIPDNKDLQRPSGFTQMEFREEIVRQICEFPVYGDPQVSSAARPAGDLCLFDTRHMPVYCDMKRNCCMLQAG